MLDVTTMVAHIDSLETTMHLLLDQMKELTSKKGKELAKSKDILMDKEMQ